MKYIYIYVSALLLFSACSENEKQVIINIIQNINIKDNEKVATVTKLTDTTKESSGLTYIDGTLWTHNDSGGEPKLYAIDKKNGKIVRTVTISNATNVDWEDLAYDSTHLFIGDFGNNMGKRKNLRIYKIKRSDLKQKTAIKAEIIDFSYATQTNFTSSSNNNFDCEAFIVYENKLYLFSKNHGDKKTDLYRLDIEAGEDVGEKIATFNTDALVTGASIDIENKVLALIGYTTKGTPRTWIFSKFTDADFFKGDIVKIKWGTPAKAQIEGVTHIAKGKLYISSEKFSYANSMGSFTIKPTLYNLNY